MRMLLTFCKCWFMWLCWFWSYSCIFHVFRDGEKPKNPMVELFYGRFLAVGVLEGMHFIVVELEKMSVKIF